VFMVTSISKAVERIKSIFFDIAVIDIHQEWNDRRDYLFLRSITWMAPKTRIILLAPDGKKESANNVEGLEISRFISKPWKYKELIASIDYLKKGFMRNSIRDHVRAYQKLLQRKKIDTVLVHLAEYKQ